MGIGTSDLGDMTTSEVATVQRSWEGVMENLGENGPYIFGSFLKKYNYIPYFKRFSTVSADELDENTSFKDHSLLVMNTINKIVLHANDPETVKNDLIELGKMHVRKNLTTQQFLELKAIIIDIMDKKFRQPLDTLKAWSKAFDVCYLYVFQGMEEEETALSLESNDFASSTSKAI